MALAAIQFRVCRADGIRRNRRTKEVAASAGNAGPYISGRRQWKVQLKPAWQLHAPPPPPPATQSMFRRKITNQMVHPTSYSSRITTDIPLYEPPGALFDEYLKDKSRVVRAMFPDKRRSQRLNEEEWRIQMLPIQFLFTTVWPVVDMRLRCNMNGKNYPPEVPCDITKVLQLDITRWKLQGLDSVLEPSHFTLGVKGALYSDRRGRHSRLKGLLEMKIITVLPLVLAVIPEDVRRSVAESVLKALVENMKHNVNSSLLADYNKFKREKQINLV